jgi:hypothetical protein
VTINRSVASGNSGSVGFYAAGTISGGTTEVNCEECVLSSNGYGFAVTQGTGSLATIRVSHSTATNNTAAGFFQSDGVFESLSNNLVRGNATDTVGTITPTLAK